MVTPFSKFYGKTLVGFCLNNGKRFFYRFHFKPTEKAQVHLKNGTKNFKNSPQFKRSACFMWQPVETLNVFNT